MYQFKDIIIVCGHYGSGKTNFSINLALDLATQGRKVSLADLDIVNPYFRSTDYTDLLTSRGITVLGQTYAGSNVDLPSVVPQLSSVFDLPGTVVLDVGGDDAGAFILGRFSSVINALDYDMHYVVNRYRSLTTQPEEAAALLKEIESACRIRATAVVNNSHLKQDTTAETILDSLPYAERASELVNLPLLRTAAPRELVLSTEGAALHQIANLYPVDVHVRTPWGT
jgi:hypothetical protein